jgi:hypothetical protein
MGQFLSLTAIFVMAQAVLYGSLHWPYTAEIIILDLRDDLVLFDGEIMPIKNLTGEELEKFRDEGETAFRN